MKTTTTTPAHGCMREHLTFCGEDGAYIMVQLYPVRSLSDKKTRQKKHRTTREVQKKLNEKNSRRKLSAQIHTNFTPKDTVVTLTYDDNHYPKTIDEIDAVEHEREKAIRRIRRLWCRVTGKPESEFKYIEVLERGKKGRLHHHIIMSGGLTRDQIQEKWENGKVRVNRLRFGERGVEKLVKYLSKGDERLRYKRWSCSRNLDKPCVEVSDDRIGREDAHHINNAPWDFDYIQNLYPGYTVCPDSVETTANEEIQLAPFVSFMLYKTNNRYFRMDEHGRCYTPPEFTDVWKTNPVKPRRTPTKRKRPRGKAAAPVPMV